MIFGFEYIEWIDQEPKEDDSDMKIESSEEKDGVHHDAKISTKGFTVTIPQAKIEWSKDVVNIIPITDNR